MDNPDYGIKSDKTHQLGANIGYFAAFLLFSSMFYFIMTLSRKIPQSIRYYHVAFFVVIVYIAGFLILKFKKNERA